MAARIPRQRRKQTIKAGRRAAPQYLFILVAENESRSYYQPSCQPCTSGKNTCIRKPSLGRRSIGIKSAAKNRRKSPARPPVLSEGNYREALQLVQHAEDGKALVQDLLLGVGGLAVEEERRDDGHYEGRAAAADREPAGQRGLHREDHDHPGDRHERGDQQEPAPDRGDAAVAGVGALDRGGGRADGVDRAGDAPALGRDLHAGPGQEHHDGRDHGQAAGGVEAPDLAPHRGARAACEPPVYEAPPPYCCWACCAAPYWGCWAPHWPPPCCCVGCGCPQPCCCCGWAGCCPHPPGCWG